MRYDTRAIFSQSIDAGYNPVSGEKDKKLVRAFEMYVSVSDYGTERKLQMFGRTDLNAIMVHHQGSLIDADYITIKGKAYHIEHGRQVQGKSAYVATEVMR